MATKKMTTRTETTKKNEPVEDLGIEVENQIDAVMDFIRDTRYLSTEVSRRESIDFLRRVIERCAELAGEITHELMKYGEEN
jgi:hypothetical protein